MEEELAQRIGCRRVFIYRNGGAGGYWDIHAWWMQPDGSPVVHAVKVLALGKGDLAQDRADAAADALARWWQDNHAE